MAKSKISNLIDGEVLKKLLGFSKINFTMLDVIVMFNTLGNVAPTYVSEVFTGLGAI